MFLRVDRFQYRMRLWITGFIGALGILLPSFAEPTLDTFRPFLEEHCQRCHGSKKQKGDYRVDLLTGDFTDRANAAAWLEARNKLQLGEMPPEDEPRPDIKSVTELSAWIAQGMREAERVALGAGSRVGIRRLNRTEFTHTVSDLLQMKFPAGESPMDFLPPDGSAEGFDKIGAALWIDPSLMTTYYQVARRIAERAIVEGPPEYPTEKMRLEFEDIPDSGAIGYMVTRLGLQPVPGGLRLVEGDTRSFGMLRYPGRRDNNVAPVNGFYRFTLKAGARPGKDGTWPRVQLINDHPNADMETLMEMEIRASWEEPELYTVVLPRDTLGNEVKVKMLTDTRLYMSQRPGEDFMRRIDQVGNENQFAESIRLSGRKIAEGWGGDRSTPDPDKLDVSVYPRVFLDYLEVEGPLYDAWPPLSHQELIGATNVETAGLEEAREALKDFIPKAWRRPVADSEMEPILNVVQDELENGGSYIDAMRSALAAVLISPNFLYLVEGDTERSTLNDFELASRLSYFLWSSMPDERLLLLAKENRLSDPEVLRIETERMLSDPKMERFVEGFARQWLRVDTFLAFTPDRYLYKEYNQNLGADFQREPLEFFKEILRSDASVLNFVDSSFLMLNQRLAEYYGVSSELELNEHDFVRVSIPVDLPRGGLLGMAGVHMAGSDGLRTKPVSRAVYVRETLFNDPPDPPPPNVGEIEPNIRGERLTVRERLLQHQELETCAACHRGLDPYGLALENFNVIGAWREQQDGEDFRGSKRPPIVVEGKLPNGAEFQDFESYKRLLLEQGNRLRRGLAEKMLVYALGRPVEPADDLWIQSTVQKMESGKDTLRTLIHELAQSRIFHRR